MFHSIIFDNGSELALLDQVKGTKIYYCHPCTPSERGSNENANGLICEFIPKGISLHKFSKKLIREVQDVLNGRLRKSLGYRSASAALQASPWAWRFPCKPGRPFLFIRSSLLHLG
ncbi:IS30 family transposase [Schleiferilactobacillus harbinensis]|uniref:IS30 family transposase n=1 Tax=Schleiferilactobacillus harbinensis TaxID=304207 RepID=UPI0021E0081B|nr:IS30 family transposase [Schleiferilactobacillus harbinensis]